MTLWMNQPSLFSLDTVLEFRNTFGNSLGEFLACAGQFRACIAKMIAHVVLKTQRMGAES